MTLLFKLFCCLLLGVFIISCSNEATLPDCGCNSETLSSIPNEKLQRPLEEQKKGLLFYKHPEITDGFYDDEQFNNRFWIFQNSPCNSCSSHLVICNQEELGNSFDFLKQSGVYDSIPVLFSGNIKRICKGPIALPTAYSYNEISLNTIKKQ